MICLINCYCPPPKPTPAKHFFCYGYTSPFFLTKTKFHFVLFEAYKTFVYFSKRRSEKKKQVIVLVRDYRRFGQNTLTLHSHFRIWRLCSEVIKGAKRFPHSELKDQVSRTEIWGATLLFGMDKIPFKIQGRISGNNF